MSKQEMFIDKNYQETRLAIVHDGILEDFDRETLAERPCKGNIYHGRIVRIEPSLQAAFVDFGGIRHGFLPFSEIHPSYYLKKEELKSHLQALAPVSSENEDIPEQRIVPASHKVQDVLKRNQMVLVQVTKDARAHKGAFLSTYVSLAGKYCVFLPNTPKSSGVSRKITQQKERSTLRSIIEDLKIPVEMSLIIRTAGVGKNKSEIKRDWSYLLKVWKDLSCSKETSPTLVYEEHDLLVRALRDFYQGDVERVVIEDKDSFLKAKKFMRIFMPTHVKKLELHQGDDPLFETYGLERQIEEIYQPHLNLPSGGSIVMNITEALIAIDVNSSKATKEKNLEETAFKTNMEAARAIARQLKLRDLAGLVVIDFIDMPESKTEAVEKTFRQALKLDRARLKVGKISAFGLLEMSRQRLRQNLWEGSCAICPSCQGQGRIYAPSFVAIKILRRIERVALKEKNLTLLTTPSVLEFLFNEHRQNIIDIEKKHQCVLKFMVDSTLVGTNFVVRLPVDLTVKPKYEPSQRIPTVQEAAKIEEKGEAPKVDHVKIHGPKQESAHTKVHPSPRAYNVSNEEAPAVSGENGASSSRQETASPVCALPSVPQKRPLPPYPQKRSAPQTVVHTSSHEAKSEGKKESSSFDTPALDQPRDGYVHISGLLPPPARTDKQPPVGSAPLLKTDKKKDWRPHNGRSYSSSPSSPRYAHSHTPPSGESHGMGGEKNAQIYPRKRQENAQHLLPNAPSLPASFDTTKKHEDQNSQRQERKIATPPKPQGDAEHTRNHKKPIQPNTGHKPLVQKAPVGQYPLRRTPPPSVVPVEKELLVRAPVNPIEILRASEQKEGGMPAAIVVSQAQKISQQGTEPQAMEKGSTVSTLPENRHNRQNRQIKNLKEKNPPSVTKDAQALSKKETSTEALSKEVNQTSSKDQEKNMIQTSKVQRSKIQTSDQTKSQMSKLNEQAPCPVVDDALEKNVKSHVAQEHPKKEGNSKKQGARFLSQGLDSKQTIEPENKDVALPKARKAAKNQVQKSQSVEEKILAPEIIKKEMGKKEMIKKEMVKKDLEKVSRIKKTKTPLPKPSIKEDTQKR